MLFSKHNYRYSGRGFTIVELLIVIVVIAILAAITIVAYNGIQKRANDSVVSSDINTFKKKLELIKVDLDRYPRTVAEFPSDLKISKTAYNTTLNNVYYIVEHATDNYAFGVRSKSLKGYILTNSGLQENVGVSGAATAAAIGVTWGAVGTSALQGYVAPPGVGWVTTWTIVNQ